MLKIALLFVLGGLLYTGWQLIQAFQEAAELDPYSVNEDDE